MIDRSTWDAALGALEVQMSSGQFAAWLKDSHFVEGGPSRLVVGVPNAFARETIERNYRPIVDDAVCDVAGRKVAVTFIIDGRLAGKPTAASPPVRQPGTRKPDPAAALKTTLASRFSFDSYVVGRGNQLAHAAAKRVSESPGNSYNPLFIYGGVGLGKTHLLRAIADAISESSPGTNVLYATSEDFTNDLVSAIRGGRTAQLRSKYRSADVLLLDDVQFVAGRESTQEELFHTFDSLQSQGKQIVFTSDRTPHEIQLLSDRLMTRFACGLVADIQPPDVETRMEVLRTRAKSGGVSLPDAVAEYMAAKITQNIRDLEGALTRVIAFADLNGRKLNVEMAKAALDGLAYGGARRIVTLEDVLEAVADHYRVEASALVGPSRRRDVSHPRQVAMYLMRGLTSYSLPAIGATLGGRDHSTILHGCQKVARTLDADADLAGEVESVRAAVLGRQ